LSLQDRDEEDDFEVEDDEDDGECSDAEQDTMHPNAGEIMSTGRQTTPVAYRHCQFPGAVMWLP